MAPRNILVTGATGKQGGSVIRALLANPPEYEHKILALTRNVDSPAAKSLAQNSRVQLIAGGFDDCDAIFEKAGGHGSVWGVFLFTLPAMGQKDAAAIEEKQGVKMVDAAKKFGVQHFVFTSVERGGEKSEENPTDVDHFISKHNIEHYLKEQFRDTEITWTILRPVCFMDNIQPNFFGKIFGAMFMNLGSTKLQFIATKDVGIFGAQSLSHPESDDYCRKAIGLAGDELDFAEANEIFWKVYGRPMPRTYWFMGTLVQKVVKEMGLMFNWFVTDGFGADISLCKRLNPELLDFEGYLRTEVKFQRW